MKEYIMKKLGDKTTNLEQNQQTQTLLINKKPLAIIGNNINWLSEILKIK